MVLACCGDIPTLETLAAVDLLREHLPELKVRVVNVVDLMRLQPTTEHPHGLPDSSSTRSSPRPAGHLRLPRLPLADPPADLPPHEPREPARARLQGGGHDHDAVRHGLLNDLDRFHLVIDVIDRVPGLADRRPAAEGGRRPAHARPRLHARARRGRPGDPRLGLAVLTRGLGPRRQCRFGEPEALRRRAGRDGHEARLTRTRA